VTTTARCKEGTVVSSNLKLSVADVKVVEQGGVDCDATGCRAWTATAERDNGESFDITLDVVCTGDGQTELETLIQEAIRTKEAAAQEGPQ